MSDKDSRFLVRNDAAHPVLEAGPLSITVTGPESRPFRVWYLFRASRIVCQSAARACFRCQCPSCDDNRVLLLISGVLLSRRVVLRTGGGAISTWPPSRLDLHQNTMPIDPATYRLRYRYDARFFSSPIYARVESLDENGEMKRPPRRDNVREWGNSRDYIREWKSPYKD